MMPSPLKCWTRFATSTTSNSSFAQLIETCNKGVLRHSLVQLPTYEATNIADILEREQSAMTQSEDGGALAGTLPVAVAELTPSEHKCLNFSSRVTNN
eukprot:6176321-Pleurochrysis_carterae.AAC.5